MQAELEALAASLRIRERVIFLGETTQSDLADLIPHCLTLSPVTGLALIECGLGGSPIVAYDRDWQADFVEDGESGYVVASRDWPAMAARAVEILRDPALARRFGEAIRRRALEHMDAERMQRTEHAAFARLLDR
jgi:glycosyltransferase involved in cell wall biosynthesis